MALYTAVTATRTGTLCTGVAVASSDTINVNDLNAGAILVVTAAATPCTVTFTDAGLTPAGTAAGTVTGVTVAANTSRAFSNIDEYANTTTGLVTVNYSATTNITAMLIRD